MSRHRGAKPHRRYGRSDAISLLSPAYLLSVELWPFHTEPQDHLGRLSLSARAVALAVKQASTYTLDDRLPTGLSLPLHSSVTLLEETAPVKLTA